MDAPKTPKSNLKAIAKYDAKNCIRMNLKLNIKTDADIIQALNNAPNKQGYIKQAIRSKMHIETILKARKENKEKEQ